jgi:hypothetical protein
VLQMMLPLPEPRLMPLPEHLRMNRSRQAFLLP